jgi:transcriptional regulator with XRE-family HTH domain
MGISMNEKGARMLRLRVRPVAEAKGYSIQRLHEESGVSYDTVLKYWHNQVRRIDTTTLAALAKALQTTSIDLLEEDGE